MARYTRIIPARAGSREPLPPCRRRVWDHPRACGEQHLVLADAQVARRIIPARAGSSERDYRPAGMGADHPRACGEQHLCSLLRNQRAGSSPRVRGAVLSDPDTMIATRIIPARAGSRRSRAGCRRPWPDHPRACGEQESHSLAWHSPQGSSPRVRGAVPRHQATSLRLRIIPARAGSSSRPCSP